MPSTMALYKLVVPRDDSDSANSGLQTQNTLLIVLIIIIAIIAASLGALYFLKRRKLRNRGDLLPISQPMSARHLTDSETNLFNESTRRFSSLSVLSKTPMSPTSSAKPLMVRTDIKEVKDDSLTSPTSPLPEIRVHFPEEFDEQGKRTSGKIVRVHVGEHGDGLEPYEEKLEPYQTSESDRFESLDMERIGGLKEKQAA